MFFNWCFALTVNVDHSSQILKSFVQSLPLRRIRLNVWKRSYKLSPVIDRIMKMKLRERVRESVDGWRTFVTVNAITRRRARFSFRHRNSLVIWFSFPPIKCRTCKHLFCYKLNQLYCTVHDNNEIYSSRRKKEEHCKCRSVILFI